MRGRLAEGKLLLSLAIGLSAAGLASAAQGDTSRTVLDFLPVGESRVEIVALALPAECQELEARFEEAVRAQPDWFMSYAAGAEDTLASGEPLPYHENFGLSREEYERMLWGMLHEVTLVPVDVDTLILRKYGERYTFVGGRKLAALWGLSFDEASGELITSDGERVIPEWVAAREAPIGVWSGVSWTSEVGDPAAGSARRLAVSSGTFDATGQGIFTYSLRVIDGGMLVDRADIRITFERGGRLPN